MLPAFVIKRAARQIVDGYAALRVRAARSCIVPSQPPTTCRSRPLLLDAMSPLSVSVATPKSQGP